jgi:hypothetical protein
MTFHRLSVPVYVGGLPAGYDYLNDPVANAFPGAGVPAPTDTGPLSSTSSPNAGTYFVGFGEDGRAFAPNRGLFALGTNTDFIDDFLHGDFAVLASTDFAFGSPAVLVGTVASPIFVGPPGTLNTAAGLEQYFHVTDQNNNDIVDASNVQCIVTAVSGGVGTFFTGSLTLTLNITPPAAYRVWYGARSSLIEMTRGNLIRSSVWGVARKPASLFQFANDLLSNNIVKGATTVGLNTTGFTAATLTAVNNGGLGTAGISTVRDGFLAVDRAIIRRRSFMGVFTDGTASTGGDYNGPNAIDPVIATLFSGGTYFFRPGSYSITDAGGPGTSQGALWHVHGDAAGTSLSLAAARSTDFILAGGLIADELGISSDSTANKRFSVLPGVGSPFILRNSFFQTGSISCEGGSGGGFVLEDSAYFSPGVGSPVASLEMSGEARVALRRNTFADASNDGVNLVYLHDFADDTQSSVEIEDTYFASFEADIDAVRLFNVTVPVTFRNCVFEMGTNLGAGYPVRLINNNASVSFENCLFRGANGLCFWAAGSLFHLKGCRFISSDANPGAASSQMIMANGDVNGALCSIRDCTVTIGASSVKGNAANIQRAIVEIGGTANFATTDRPILVDGFNVTYSASVPSLHNFVTVLLHGGTSAGVPGQSVRTYKNVTVNGNNIFPDNTGTLGGVYRTPTAYPTLVTIGGGDSRASTIVENLHIVNVANPSVDHDRQVLFAYRAILRDVVIDGASITSAGKFTRDPVELWECDAFNLSLERRLSLKTNQSHLVISKTTRLRGGEFIGRVNVDPFSYIQYGDSHCVIDGFTVQFPSIIITSTSPIFSCPQQCCELINCRVFMDGDWGGRLVNFSAGADLARVSNNFLFWRRNAGQMLLSAGAGSMVNDNTLASTNTAAPTFSVTGANAIDDNNNAFLQSGSVANPV